MTQPAPVAIHAYVTRTSKTSSKGDRSDVGIARLRALTVVVLIVIAAGLVGHFLIDAVCDPVQNSDPTTCTTGSILGQVAESVCALHCNFAAPESAVAGLIGTLTYSLANPFLFTPLFSIPPLVPPPVRSASIGWA